LHTKTLAQLREYCPDIAEIREHIREVEQEIRNLRGSLECSLLATSEYTAMNRAFHAACRPLDAPPRVPVAPRI